ncbi:MAG: cupin domain-containing protein [Oscillospiraceae bacterium]|nr:cupin domain-containing protein [Oscillospiraceae bacterium]
MIKRRDSLDVTVNENMRGGDGRVSIEHILGKGELYEKGRLYARLIIKQGCSIGYHVHEGEMETFYVIRGTATYNDNGKQTELQCGDVAYTPAGSGHSVANNGAEDLEIIALIVYQ